MQRGERLFIKEQRKLAEEHQQISSGVHGQMTLGSDFASRIAEQRSQFLYEDAKQRKERLETKMELEEERYQRSARSTPHLGRSQDRFRARSETPARVNQREAPEASSSSPIPKAQNMFEVLRPESSGARKLLQAASRSKMQSAVMSQMVMSRVVQAFGQTRP